MPWSVQNLKKTTTIVKKFLNKAYSIVFIFLYNQSRRLRAVLKLEKNCHFKKLLAVILGQCVIYIKFATGGRIYFWRYMAKILLFIFLFIYSLFIYSFIHLFISSLWWKSANKNAETYLNEPFLGIFGRLWVRLGHDLFHVILVMFLCDRVRLGRMLKRK